VLLIDSGTVDPRSPGGRPSRWAATGRSGGISRPPFDTLNLAAHVGDDPDAVAENLARAAAAVGAADIAVIDAVHGAEVAVVDAPGAVHGVDAMVTRRAGLALVALGADCVPLALMGADDITVAVAHCGWQGLVADVVGAVVTAMGGTVQRVILGPSVCGTCYPVPTERADRVRDSVSAEVGTAALVTCADGQPGIDVRRGVRARLRELGVDADAITTAGGCTLEDPRLYSYRRDGRTGRQGIVVVRDDTVARMDA
jgi:YfiH family protein